MKIKQKYPTIPLLPKIRLFSPKRRTQPLSVPASEQDTCTFAEPSENKQSLLYNFYDIISWVKLEIYRYSKRNKSIRLLFWSAFFFSCEE